MNSQGQIYRAEEGQIPPEDKDRFDAFLMRDDVMNQLERLAAEHQESIEEKVKEECEQSPS